jgi:hypothetical protein
MRNVTSIRSKRQSHLENKQIAHGQSPDSFSLSGIRMPRALPISYCTTGFCKSWRRQAITALILGAAHSIRVRNLAKGAQKGEEAC